MACFFRILWFFKAALIVLLVIGIFFSEGFRVANDDLGKLVIVGGGFWALISVLVGWRVVFYDKISTVFVGMFCILLGGGFSVFMFEKLIGFYEDVPGAGKYILVYFWPWAIYLFTLVYLIFRKKKLPL